ncbi:hypothetical protein Pint_10891 [Pistacia integerrima]|uniref:Uncharacterized protein n=1 Tax=Pistacia integerrima TaxID=434235 RepID=A0ACC0XEQ6_9ROSI|nr:hypothetical protein Pint_10891 [Pistacia integerrima]
MSRFPADPDAQEASGLPWGVTVKPFATKDENGVKPVYGSDGNLLPRCDNCYAYFNAPLPDTLILSLAPRWSVPSLPRLDRPLLLLFLHLGKRCQMMEQEIKNLSKDKQELQEKFSQSEGAGN